jgi:histidinol phosphate phosphatase HisJ family
VAIQKTSNELEKFMAKSNFHMHTIFCDGKSSPEDYVLVALNRGMESIGFSAHAPIGLAKVLNMKAEMVEVYFAEIARLKRKYAKQIEIYAGFEMDYLITENKNIIMKYVAEADYIIGSVHYIYDVKSAKYYSIADSVEDASAAFKEIGKGNNQVCVNAYYQDLIRIIREYRPTIIGHLDIIKKRNKGDIYFNENEKWYINLVSAVLDEVVLSKAVIEVNTGGISRGFCEELYPSNWILKECYRRKVPIILTSDAHKAEDINAFFIETIEQLKEIGFTHQKTLKAGQWVDVEL